MIILNEDLRGKIKKHIEEKGIKIQEGSELKSGEKIYANTVIKTKEELQKLTE
jgi:ribosome-associated protein YbcJ (S4-like RNA binding protein)